jgi:hypothetical protein
MLKLGFDFARSRSIDETAEFLREEIGIGLSRFKSYYAKCLGQSFTSDAAFWKDDPAGNLGCLIEAVDLALLHHRDTIWITPAS